MILSAGMRETVIRSKFDKISHAFLEWQSAREITKRRSDCEKKALAVFANVRKVRRSVF